MAFMLDLAASCYPGIDLNKLSLILMQWLRDPRAIILLGPDCAVGAGLCERVWTSGRFIETLFICGRRGRIFNVIQLCRAIMDLGRQRGADEFRLNSWTNFPVHSIAVRLRYNRAIPTYAVPL